MRCLRLLLAVVSGFLLLSANAHPGLHQDQGMWKSVAHMFSSVDHVLPWLLVLFLGLICIPILSRIRK